METQTNVTPSGKIGKWSSVSLVVGNMIGAGIFLTPAVLASYGGISLLGWLMSTLGAVFIALLFSRLSKLIPNAQGGIYAYTRDGLGEFPAFMVSWGYWFSNLTTNAALVVAFISYLSVLIPFVNQSAVTSAAFAILTVWLLTWVNTFSLKKVGQLATVTTILKTLPIIAISVAGLFLFQASHFQPFNLSGQSDWQAIVAATAVTFFSYLGIESATIPSQGIRDPEKTIPFATRWGTTIAALIYILSSFSVMGLVSPVDLASSTAPFADAAAVIWGEEARYFVGFAGAISAFGALNGWILIMGQVQQATANDGLAPSIFKKTNKNQMPAIGLLISAVLITFLIVTNYSGGLLKVFQFMILVSTVSVLIPYLLCAISYAAIVKKLNPSKALSRDTLLIVILSSAFSLYALFGSGFDSVFWGLLFLVAGIPVFLFLKKRHHE
ncbi:MAG: amino acid permease [Cyclobacteriaceae bacterium]